MVGLIIAVSLFVSNLPFKSVGMLLVAVVFVALLFPFEG
jgi:hypothetical protein